MKDMNEIILGDCLEEMQKLPDSSVDLIVTDPPYSFPVAQFRPEARIKQRTFGDFSTYQHFFTTFLDQAIRVTKKAGDIYVFCDETFYAVLFPLFYSRFYSTKMLIWNKGRIGMGGIWRRQFEVIIHARMLPNEKKSGDGDIILCPPVPSSAKQHNSQKPVDLVKKIIEKNTPTDGLVLDPFLGSGTTAVAAVATGRRYVGIEIDPENVAIAKSRL